MVQDGSGGYWTNRARVVDTFILAMWYFTEKSAVTETK